MTQRTRRALSTAALALIIVPFGAGTEAKTSTAPLCQDRVGTEVAESGSYRVLGSSTRSKSDPDAGILRVISCKLGSRSAKVLVKHSSNLEGFMRITDGAFSSGPTTIASRSPSSPAARSRGASSSSASRRAWRPPSACFRRGRPTSPSAEHALLGRELGREVREARRRPSGALGAQDDCG